MFISPLWTKRDVLVAPWDSNLAVELHVPPRPDCVKHRIMNTKQSKVAAPPNLGHEQTEKWYIAVAPYHAPICTHLGSQEGETPFVASFGTVAHSSVFNRIDDITLFQTHRRVPEKTTTICKIARGRQRSRMRRLPGGAWARPLTPSHYGLTSHHEFSLVDAAMVLGIIFSRACFGTHVSCACKR
jgi:hypothetical protein